MIKFIKMDFMNVRWALGSIFNKKIPFGIALLYYILMMPIGLILMPFAYFWTKIKIRRILKQFEEA